MENPITLGDLGVPYFRKLKESLCEALFFLKNGSNLCKAILWLITKSDTLQYLEIRTIIFVFFNTYARYRIVPLG